MHVDTDVRQRLCSKGHPSLMTPPHPSRPLGSRSAPAPRVLIVDDDQAVRTVLRRWFARRGWHADEAADGDQARAVLSAASGTRFHMVLCDVRMPKLSGPRFFDWLSRSRPSVLARLVFTTGDVSEDSVAAFLRESGCTVVAKPFDLNALWAVAERLRREPVAA